MKTFIAICKGLKSLNRQLNHRNVDDQLCFMLNYGYTYFGDKEAKRQGLI